LPRRAGLGQHARGVVSLPLRTSRAKGRMTVTIERRKFLATLGGAALAWPLAARAQQGGRIYRLGVLIPAGRQAPAVLALFDELRSNGFIEGQNLTVITEGFEAIDDRLAERAAALAKAAPDAIVAGPELPLRALQAVTRTIPLIGMTEDMVAAG